MKVALLPQLNENEPNFDLFVPSSALFISFSLLLLFYQGGYLKLIFDSTFFFF